MKLRGAKQIPKPVGEAGRPGRGGYNLEKTLRWSPKSFKKVKVTHCVRVRFSMFLTSIFRLLSKLAGKIPWTAPSVSRIKT